MFEVSLIYINTYFCVSQTLVEVEFFYFRFLRAHLDVVRAV